MKDERLINAAAEVWNCDRLSIDDFLRYAYIAKLLAPDRYRDWREKRKGQSLEEKALSSGIGVDANEEADVDAVWSLNEGAQSSEGSYLLTELRRQLRHSVSELHAFRDEIDAEYKLLEGSGSGMERVHFPCDDDEGHQAWCERSGASEEASADRDNQTVFPRALHGYLVVPAPPESVSDSENAQE